MRAELPTGAGMWPAFWLLPQEHVWPPELDALEAFGETTTNGDGGAYSLHQGLLTSGTGSQGSWSGTGGANLYSQYNTFGVDWEPDAVTFYFNGSAYARMATPSDFHQPMYMLANLAVGGNWAGAPVGEAADLKIDYIRAYSKDGSNPAVVQSVTSSPDGRGRDLYGATDANGRGALGGVDLPPLPSTAPVQFGSGNDRLILTMSEEVLLEDAQFAVTIDGVRIGGTQTVTAARGYGQVQTFEIAGDFRPGAHTVAIEVLNGTAGCNLFSDGATIDGAAIPGAAMELLGGKSGSFAFDGPTSAPVVLGSGKDALTLWISDQPWHGHAQFAIVVDGVQIGGVQTATAWHVSGATQSFEVRGDFSPGQHVVCLRYLNDAWGGDSDRDRNLYLDGTWFNGVAVPGGALALHKGGVQGLSFTAPVADPAGRPSTVTNTPAHAVAPISMVSVGDGPDTLALAISEDAWHGHARFTVSVDGIQVGGVQTATASHAAGVSQDFEFHAAFGPGSHEVLVDYLNDAWGGSAQADRNLYVDAASYNGSLVPSGNLDLTRGGARTLTVPKAAGAPIGIPPTAPAAAPAVPPMQAPATAPHEVLAFTITDTVSMASSESQGDFYFGPVALLERQFIWSSPHGVALASSVPNVFMHGGEADDALRAFSGGNVLDGGAGSNFLVGATGADGALDTFFVDGRNGVTWSTVVNFHHGDDVTIWSFRLGVSTMPWAEADGADHAKGATIHSEFAGVGTGITASATFAEMAVADLLAKTTISTGSIGGLSYLNVNYTH